MKHLLSIAFFVLVYGLLRGQAPSGFLSPGAQWSIPFTDCVSFFCDPLVYGVERLTYVGDEMINGKLCQRIDVVNGYEPVCYLYEENGIVYYLHAFDGPEFRKLYDFTVQAGDFFLMENALGGRDTVRVDAVYPDTLNGVALKVWEARLLCWGGIEAVPLRYNNRFGAMNAHPIYASHACLLDWLRTYDFRCYADDAMPLYNPSGIPCDSILSTAPIAVERSVRFGPNPASERLWIEHARGTRWSFGLFDVSGHLQIMRHMAGDQHRLDLDVSGLAPGLYFAFLYDFDGRVWWRAPWAVSR